MSSTMTSVVRDTATDWVAIDPTPGEVETALIVRADEADKGQRARLLNFGKSFSSPHWSLSNPTERAAMGLAQWGGWGVPNAYRQRATTSAAGVAWFTDRQGRTHVRCTAARVAAKKSSFGRDRVLIFGDLDGSNADDCVRAVYPSLRAPEMVFAYHRIGPKAKRWPPLKVALLDATQTDPLDVASWAALADWYDEAGEVALSAKCKEAMDTACVIGGGA